MKSAFDLIAHLKKTGTGEDKLVVFRGALAGLDSDSAEDLIGAVEGTVPKVTLKKARRWASGAKPEPRTRIGARTKRAADRAKPAGDTANLDLIVGALTGNESSDTPAMTVGGLVEKTGFNEGQVRYVLRQHPDSFAEGESRAGVKTYLLAGPPDDPSGLSSDEPPPAA